jgi:hypothetical protein
MAGRPVAVKESLEAKFFNYNEKAVVQSPDDINPTGAVPEPTKKEDEEEIEIHPRY